MQAHSDPHFESHEEVALAIGRESEGRLVFFMTPGTGSSNLVTGGPVPVFTVGAINVQDGTGVIITGPGVVGTSAIGSATINTPAQSNSISVQTRSCSTGTGNWAAGIGFGSGSITVTSASSTGVSGSFSATLEPGPGFSGTRTITGTFSATF